MRRSWSVSLASVVPMLVALSVTGQEIPNWYAPPTWTPPRPEGAISVMAEISNPLPFVPVDPCRVADTRSGQGFSGQAGPPILTGNATRTFQISGTVTGVPVQCGIPTTARAVSFQFTVVNMTSGGNLIAWPAGAAQPSVSVLNWNATSVAIGNGIVVPVSSAGALSVNPSTPAGAFVDLIVDVNGYFYDSQLGPGAISAGRYFGIIGDRSGGPVVLGRNTNATANSYGIQGEATANGSGSAGVYGLASSTSGTVFGTLGKSSSTAIDSAGVKGVDGTGSPAGATSFPPAGVRGESTTAVGLLGVSRFVGVRGDVLNVSGASLAEGRLGYSVSGTNYGAYAVGDIGATGTKSFVLPHPNDPSLVIRFISLEGPEAGTYFRGRGRLEGRAAVIEVPESFRLVTEPDSLSVQLTSVGRNGALWVSDLNLDQIVVQGARDVEFFYTVNGVRRDYARFEAIAHSNEFVPESAASRLSESLSDTARRNLVTNGAYHPDGSVNLETARALSWDRIWAQRAAAAD